MIRKALRGLAGAGLAGLVALSATGCRVEQMPDSTEMTVIDAKAQVAAQEDRILAAVPTQYVVGVNQRVTQAQVLDCSDGSFWWPGGMFVGLDPETDPQAVIDAVSVAYRTDPDWAVDEDGTVSPSPYAVRLSQGGEFGSDGALSISVAVLELADGGYELSIGSRSRCFPLNDHDPFTEY